MSDTPEISTVVSSLVEEVAVLSEVPETITVLSKISKASPVVRKEIVLSIVMVL